MYNKASYTDSRYQYPYQGIYTTAVPGSLILVFSRTSDHWSGLVTFTYSKSWLSFRREHKLSYLAWITRFQSILHYAHVRLHVCGCQDQLGWGATKYFQINNLTLDICLLSKIVLGPSPDIWLVSTIRGDRTLMVPCCSGTWTIIISVC